MLTYEFIEQKPRQLRLYEDHMAIIKTLNELHISDYTLMYKNQTSYFLEMELMQC